MGYHHSPCPTHAWAPEDRSVSLPHYGLRPCLTPGVLAPSSFHSVLRARLQACPNAAPSLFGRPLYPPGPTPGVPQCSAPSLNGLPTFAVPDTWRPAWAPEDRSVSLPPKKGEREKRLHVILIKDNVHAQTVTVRYRLRPGPTQNVYAPSIVRLARCSPGLTQDVHAPSNC